jgi:hypothetical protein
MEQKIDREIIEEILETAELFDDGDEVNIREGYSGRGMYGRTCFGIVFENEAALFRFMAAAGRIEADREHDERPGFDSFSLARSVRTDRMMRGVIAYWPGWNLQG